MPRLTSHGETVFFSTSNGKTTDNFWGDFKSYWPYPIKEVTPVGCGSCNQSGPPAPPSFSTVEDWYTHVEKIPSDFNEHMKILRSLVRKDDTVVEVSSWLKPALLSMAAGSPKVLKSICGGAKPEWEQLRTLVPGFEGLTSSSPIPCDLLFLDTKHTADQVFKELTDWAPLCRRNIVIHTTEIFGENGDDGGPGVLVGIRRYLQDHKEWTVVRQDRNNYGLIVLSKAEEDKKTPPGILRKALNFSKALAAHAKDGNRLVDDKVWHERIEKCLLCPKRNHDTCSACGCGISLKASWNSSECPLDPPLWKKEN